MLGAIASALSEFLFLLELKFKILFDFAQVPDFFWKFKQINKF